MLLDDVADLLSTGGVSNVYKSRLPDAVTTPAAVAIYETGGFFPIHAMSSGPGTAKVERPRIQVATRAASYESASVTANFVSGLLDGLREKTQNGTRYLYLQAVHAPFLLKFDEGDRPILAQNFDVWKARSTATST